MSCLLRCPQFRGILLLVYIVDSLLCSLFVPLHSFLFPVETLCNWFPSLTRNHCTYRVIYESGILPNKFCSRSLDMFRWWSFWSTATTISWTTAWTRGWITSSQDYVWLWFSLYLYLWCPSTWWLREGGREGEGERDNSFVCKQTSDFQQLIAPLTCIKNANAMRQTRILYQCTCQHDCPPR